MERLSDKAIEIINELHRERLDYESEYLLLIDCAQRCAAYEDTGLEPEEIELMKEAQDIAENMSPQRLAEILGAEKAGRLVVLPCREELLESCTMRHVDNCFPAGGFCCPDTAVCIALHNAYDMGKLSVTRQETEESMREEADNA